MSAVIFETDRLLVRPYVKGDEENFFALNGNEEVVRYIRAAKTKAECDEFLLTVISDYAVNPLYGRWAVEEKQSRIFVGSFALIPVEGLDQMQLGYALLPGQWGKGYATELTKAGLDYIFEKTAIDPIYAYTEAPNTASQKVLLKAGFQPDGTRTEGSKELTGFRLNKKDWEIKMKENPLQAI